MGFINRDIKCIDSEIKSVSNEIVNYIDSLYSSIAEYNKILANVQIKGIEDQKIRAKLYNLSVQLKKYQTRLLFIKEQYRICYSGYLNEFDQNDKFQFPNEEIDAINVLIGKFF